MAIVLQILAVLTRMFIILHCNEVTSTSWNHIFLEGMFISCCKESQIWIKVCSQKKNEHYVNVALAGEPPHFLTRALCSRTAGKSGMCSHVVGLLKQTIHYALMKVKTVPDDLTCTQMQ